MPRWALTSYRLSLSQTLTLPSAYASISSQHLVRLVDETKCISTSLQSFYFYQVPSDISTSSAASRAAWTKPAQRISNWHRTALTIHSFFPPIPYLLWMTFPLQIQWKKRYTANFFINTLCDIKSFFPRTVREHARNLPYMQTKEDGSIYLVSFLS